MSGLALAACAIACAGPAAAQGRGCTVTSYADPPRETLSCPDGLTITAEGGAAYRLRNRNGRPEGLDLTSKGVLVEVPPGRRGGFQIQTPHAIASVRGTVWAVEVAPERSSVFVQTGTVAVNRPGGPAVTLQAGDGVDVGPGADPLEVRRWGRERALLFLGRFGR
ncbi:FecR domain-containing protein [Enterovirga sp. DB1703]|uniref:FecR domain-containing protein n=2 Tax=Enterovirga aerilata TaxID=2730920 RepID=A0A849IFW2_9HYPH|nr:FecR family protein [Enterovirga sp. DB1703]NNM75105.1 FecR domain-containing protein [Enterovirga sp. DB1703]